MIVYGLSDCGKTRKKNEDMYCTGLLGGDKTVYAAVCDGMGGATGGNMASTIAINAIKDVFDEYSSKSLHRTSWLKALTLACNNANENIYNTALSNPRLLGMGTTFVGVICKSDKATFINVGDSRAYLINEEGITQITKDHSLVGEMVRNGELTALAANKHPDKNVITRALGVEKTVEADIFNKDIKSGDYILLCSDGLTNEVTPPEIHFEVLNSASVEESCRSLISIANKRGGHDNITVVLVKV